MHCINVKFSGLYIVQATEFKIAHAYSNGVTAATQRNSLTRLKKPVEGFGWIDLNHMFVQLNFLFIYFYFIKITRDIQLSF
jgi:hypothetical protein